MGNSQETVFKISSLYAFICIANTCMLLIVLGLTPSDSWEVAKADMINDGIQDMMAKALQFYLEKDEEQKVNNFFNRATSLVESFFGAVSFLAYDRCVICK